MTPAGHPAAAAGLYAGWQFGWLTPCGKLTFGMNDVTLVGCIAAPGGQRDSEVMWTGIFYATRNEAA